ncbi:MAG: hypothetical protein ACK5MV_12560 [Aminipila sp.]
MTKRRPLTVIGVLVTEDTKGNTTERLWTDISEDEKELLRIKLTDNAMKAAGYVRSGS